MQEIKKWLFSKIKDTEKANFYEYLSVMIEWGVAISKALDTLDKRIKNKYFLSKILELKWLVNTWDNLSKAMKKTPWIFDDSEIAIIESWENSWKLEQSLATLSEKLKDRHELKKKVKNSLTYPMIIFVFLLISVTIVMVFVIPNLMPIFVDAKIDLPLATKALIWTSNFIKWNFLLIVFLILATWFFISGYKKTESWKTFFDNLLLNIPVIWDLARNYILANISINMWTLIAWGIPIIKALDLTWRATNNVVYIEAFEEIKEGISKWNKIVDSMIDSDKSWDLFPSDFLQMLSVWEKTASIQKVCLKINKQYNREVQNSLEALTKWVEPIAILLAWVFVSWFAFAVFWAILKVTQSI